MRRIFLQTHDLQESLHQDLGHQTKPMLLVRTSSTEAPKTVNRAARLFLFWLTKVLHLFVVYTGECFSKPQKHSHTIFSFLLVSCVIPYKMEFNDFLII